MRGHTLERAIVITMLVGLASEFLYAYSLGMREPQEMETGYMVRTNYTMEQLERLASRVKEANATVVRVIELGVNATIENGTYVYNFSRWDQVIEIFVNHGLKILLDPQFHDVRFHPEWDESAYVLAGGRRMEHCPSIFDHRVRDYVVQTTEAIAKHYKYERPDLGDELIGIVLFNEPFMFNFCVWNPFVQEEPVIRRMLDEDPNHVEQDFRVQTEKFGEIVREMDERIKKHLDVPTLVTAELFYFMNPYATALYDSAWRYTDIVAIQLYIGPFEPFSWWIQKASIEKAILLGKPVWITEFGYNADIRKLDYPPPDYIVKFVEEARKNGVSAIFYYYFDAKEKKRDPWALSYPLYYVKEDEFNSENYDVYMALAKVYGEINENS